MRYVRHPQSCKMCDGLNPNIPGPPAQTDCSQPNGCYAQEAVNTTAPLQRKPTTATVNKTTGKQQNSGKIQTSTISSDRQAAFRRMDTDQQGSFQPEGQL